jgi:hypothetical protein
MQIKLPKNALRNSAVIGGIVACLLLAIVTILRLVVPSQARPGDDLRTEDHQKTAHNDVIAQAPSGNCNNNGTFTGTMNNNCPTIVGPPREPNGLYQTNERVGLVAAARPGPNSDQVTFQDLRIGSGNIDLSAPIEFQNVLVKCPMLEKMPHAGAMTVSS